MCARQHITYISVHLVQHIIQIWIFLLEWKTWVANEQSVIEVGGLKAEKMNKCKDLNDSEMGQIVVVK